MKRAKARHLALVATVVACVALPSSTSASAVADNQPAQAAALAKTIVGAGKLRPAVKATVQALGRGGFSVTLGSKTVGRGATPRLSERIHRAQAVLMALEARDRQSIPPLTLRNLGTLLVLVGGLPRSKSDRLVVALMNEWLAAARANPRSPYAFVPAFLAEMAKRKSPSVDLASPFNPEDVRLTELEWVLLLGAFERGVPVARSRTTSSIQSQSDADRPCSDLSEVLKTLGYSPPVPIQKHVLEDLFSTALEGAVEEYTKDADKAAALATAFKIGKILLRAHSLWMFLRYSQIEVGADKTEVHKGSGREYSIEMYAVVGLNQEGAKELAASGFLNSEFVRAARDCARQMGFPVPDDLKDLADSIKDWRVYWSEFGANSLAIAKLRFGSQRTGLTIPLNEFKRAAKLDVQIQAERPHPDNSDWWKVTSAWGVTAELESSQPPDFLQIRKVIQSVVAGRKDYKDFMKRANIGLELAEAISDILANWTRTFVKPRARGYINVSQHIPCPGAINPRLPSGTLADGPTCEEMPRVWVAAISGTSNRRGESVNVDTQWTATARFARVGPLPTGADGAKTWAYEAVSGRVNWTHSGKNGPCTESSSGGVPIGRGGGTTAASGTIGIMRKGNRYSYNAIVSAPPFETQIVQMNCPDGSGKTRGGVMAATLWGFLDRPMRRGDRVLSGSLTHRDGGFTGTWNWTFTAVGN